MRSDIRLACPVVRNLVVWMMTASVSVGRSSGLLTASRRAEEGVGLMVRAAAVVRAVAAVWRMDLRDGCSMFMFMFMLREVLLLLDRAADVVAGVVIEKAVDALQRERRVMADRSFILII
jgi:hypothetical protein